MIYWFLIVSMCISIWLSSRLLVLLVPQCSSIKYLYLSKLAELDRAEHNSWLIFYKWSLIEDLRGLKLNIVQFFYVEERKYKTMHIYKSVQVGAIKLVYCCLLPHLSLPPSKAHPITSPIWGASQHHLQRTKRKKIENGLKAGPMPGGWTKLWWEKHWVGFHSRWVAGRVRLGWALPIFG